MRYSSLKTWLTVLCLLVGTGSMWAADTVYKTALFGSGYNSVGNSSYSETFSATNSGFTVSLAYFNNNNNGWNYVKTGNKNNASVGTITTSAAIDKAITKVTITIDAITATSVNSITLYSGTSTNPRANSEGTFTMAQGQQSVTISAPSANKFYQISFDCKKGSSNGLVTVSKVEYYAANDGSPTSYNVNISSSIEHGTVTASPTSATSGTEVTLTATPAEGYEFGAWDVKNASTSAAITVTNNKFTMPAANVNVSATFNAIEGGGGSNNSVTYLFANMKDFSSWGTNYGKKETTFSDGAYVELASANKSTSSVTDCPVTKGGEVIFKAPAGKAIESLTFTCSQWTDKAQTITLNTSTDGSSYTATSTTSNNFVLSASDLTGVRAVKFTFSSANNQVGIKSIKVTYTDATDPTPTEKALVSIAATGTPATFWKGDAFNHNGITVTATWDDETTTDVTSSCSYSGYDMSTPGLQTVTVSYLEKTTTYGITVKTIANTQETAYTVTEAKGFIDAGKDLSTEVYVKGTISEIVTAYNSSYGNISFNISADGLTTGDQLQFYRNFKGADKQKWTDSDRKPAVGDQVVGLGKLTKYNTTYELAEGNYIVSLIPGSAPTTYTVTIADGIEHGIVTASPTSATSGTEVTLTATPAEGYEFGAWDVKDASTNEAITVTNNKFTMPAANVNVSATFNEAEPKDDFTTLPFNWAGGPSSEFTTIQGVTASGLGSDYAETNKPYLIKLDSNDDYFQIKTNEAIGVCTVKVKMLGGANTSSLKVSESSDGTNFADVETLSISGNANSQLTLTTTQPFNSASRYVRFTFVKGSNVGVGAISIEKAGATPTEKALVSIAVTGTPATFWKGDAFNHDGITVTATWDDETTTDVTSSCSFSGYDMSTTGQQTVTVSYTEGGITKEATYEITVAEEAITTLTLAGSYPTTFHVGDTFSHEGMTVTGNYNTDREGLDVTADATFTGYDMSTAGRQTVTVTYNDASTTYSIMVLGADVLFYESFDTNNSKGANDDLWNGSAGNGAIQTDNEGWTFANGTACSHSIKLGSGTKKGFATTPALGYEGDVTLTFKAAAWDANDEAVTIEVYVNDKDSKILTLKKKAWTNYMVFLKNLTAESKITISAINTSYNRFFLDEVLVAPTTESDLNPETLKVTISDNKRNYTLNETFNSDDITVTAVYTNGEEYDVTIYSTYSEPDMSTIGVKPVTISFGNTSTTFDITVRPNKPTFTPAVTSIEVGTEITFSSTTEGCTYYYTTDGTDPTTASTEGNTFTFTEDVTLKVIAVYNGIESLVASQDYKVKSSINTDFVITYADIKATRYSTEETTFTKGSYDYGYINMQFNNNGSPEGWAEQQVIQTKAGKFYNKTAINLIKKIRVYTVANTNTFSVAFGNVTKPTADAVTRPTTPTGSETISYTTYATGGITGTDNTTTNYYDFTAPGDGASYFQIINGSNAIYIYKVEITYEEGEGPTPPEPTTYAVTWNVNGTTNTDNYDSGTAITFPTSVATPEGSDKVFVGWTETAIDGTTDTEPVFVTSATATKDVTYYAVFATESTSSESEEYSFTLQPSNFSGASYATNDGTHSVKATCSTNADKTINVSYTTANTMLQSGKIQFKSSGSALYNTTNLGTIKSVTTEGAANLITYYGSTSHPTSGTTVGGGYFTIQASGGTGTTTGITVVFETSGSGASTYSGYCTIVGEPTPPPVTTTYAVTWSVNGETNSEEYDEGQAITFPTNVEVPSGFKRVFKGWVSTPITGAQDTEPEYVTSATATEDMTFYAVFAKEAIIGEATQTTLKFSKGNEGWTEGWTMTNCNDRSSYQVLTDGASIKSPAFPIDQLKSISAEIRTYNNDNNKTIDIKCGDTQVGTLTATGNSLAKKTAVLVEGLSLTGNKSLIFSSTEHEKDGGPGVGSITIIYGTDAETIYSGYCTTLSHADDDVVNVTWMVNAEPSTESVELDSDIAFPTTIEAPEGYTFVGWAATPDVESDAEPTLVTTAKATEDVTYYAVFAEAAFNSDEFILEIQPTDFTTGGYAANSGIKHKAAVSTADETVTTDVALQVSEVMRSTTTPAHIQFCKTPGFFYNTTDLGTITDVTIDGQTALKAFYGDSAHPTSGTTVGGGYFTFQADGATGYADKITITFEKTVPTYSNYTTTVYKESEETLTLVATEGDKYYATFSSKKMTFFPNTHANVRKVRSFGAALGMPVLPERCELDGQERLGYLVPAETGVLIESEVNNLTYYTISGQYTESDYADQFADNLLKPQTESGSVVFTAEPGMLYYKLAYNNYTEKTDLGFYYGASDGGAFKVKCGTAYLAVPENAGATSRGFSFRNMNDETEGLNTLQSTNEPQTIYNLQGLRMGSIQRSINIVNGRKVIR